MTVWPLEHQSTLTHVPHTALADMHAYLSDRPPPSSVFLRPEFQDLVAKARA